MSGVRIVISLVRWPRFNRLRLDIEYAKADEVFNLLAVRHEIAFTP